MNDTPTAEERLLDAVLELTSTGEKVTVDAARRLQDLVVDARKTRCLSYTWMRLGCLPAQLIAEQLNNRVGPNFNRQLALDVLHSVDTSSFSQELRHDYSVEDPPFYNAAAAGDIGPDRWAFIYEEPGKRQWLSMPSNFPQAGESWTKYRFSWIYAGVEPRNTVAYTGGWTEVTGRFYSELQIDYQGVVCIEVRSRAPRIGYGQYAYGGSGNPNKGYFAARHGVCISTGPQCAAGSSLFDQSSREVWRVTFEPEEDGSTIHSSWSGEPQNLRIPGSPSMGAWGRSELAVSLPIKGPGTVYCVECVTYVVRLTQGQLQCPPYPHPLDGFYEGLHGQLEPVLWHLRWPR
jgi:hypothetical protein